MKFNKALDPKTVTVDNFAVTQTGDAAGSDRLTGAGATNAIGTTDTGSAVLSADGKTVILTLNNRAALANPTSVTVTVSANVKDTSGKAVEATTKTVSFSDSTVPVAEKVETVGSNQFRVIFSEPVTTTADTNDTGLNANLAATTAFVVDNNAVAVTNVARDPQNPRALLVTVSGNLSEGEHTVRVNPAGTATNVLIRDYAGYAVVQTDLTYNHVADTTAPTVTAVSRNERTVLLTFNKPVRLTNPGNNVEFRLAYNSANAANVTSADMDALTAGNQTFAAAAVAGSNGTQYDITFANPIPAGENTLFIHYNTDTNAAGRIVDTFGNVLPNDTSVKFNVTADTTAPTVTNVEVVDATHIDVTYSEEVNNATVPTNYTLTNPQGNAVAITDVQQRGTSNTYRLTVASMAAGGNYTLSISSNITDTSVSANRLAPYTTTLNVGDLQAPTVNTVTINNTLGRIYIEYSEPMATTGPHSALDVNNYRTATVGGVQSALPAGTTITQNGNIVTIALPSALPADQVNLVIGQVADAAGNKIAALQTVVLMGNAATGFTTTVDQVRVTDRDTVTFRVGRHLRAVNASQIVVDRNPAADVTAESASFVNNADGTATVTATFAANSFATDLNGINDLDLGAGALTDINNLTSAAMANQGLAADADRVAPVMVTDPALGNQVAATFDNDNDGQIDQVVVAFSEDLYIPSVTESDFTVEGYTITRVDVRNTPTVALGAGSEVVLTLQEKATPDTGVTPRVTLVGSVQDDTAQRNELGAQAAVTPFDAAAPRMVSAVATSDNTLVITFTENISVGTGATAAGVAGQFAVDNDDNNTTPSVAATNYSISGNQLTLTFDPGTFTAGQDIGDILYTEHATVANRITDGNQTLATGASLADANTTTGF